MDPLTFVATILGSLVWPGTIVWFAWKFRKPFSTLIESVSDFEGFGAKVKIRQPYAKASESAESAVEEIESSTIDIDQEFTELIDVEVDRVDAVKDPAHGQSFIIIDRPKVDPEVDEVRVVLGLSSESEPKTSTPPPGGGSGGDGERIRFYKSKEEPPTLNSHVAGEGNPWLRTIQDYGPTSAVLAAWEGVQNAVGRLAAASLERPNGRPLLSADLRALQRTEVVGVKFIDAVRALQAVRNDVAHGRSIPNIAEGISFISSAWELERACDALIQFRGEHLPDH